MDLNILGYSFNDLGENSSFKDFLNGLEEKYSYGRYYLVNYTKGIEFVLDEDKTVHSVHFFGKGHKEYNMFKGNLPYNISITDTKFSVYEKFEKFEVKKGGGEVLPIIGRNNEWSIFKIENYYFRFEFKDGYIALITLTNLE